MLWQGVTPGRDVHPPGHAKVPHQQMGHGTALWAEVEQQVFSATCQIEKSCTAQPFFELGWGGGTQHSGALNPHITNRLVFKQWPQMANQHLDFRKFRHARRVTNPPSMERKSASALSAPLGGDML